MRNFLFWKFFPLPRNMNIDLPRDELIGWISKQLMMGVRTFTLPPSKEIKTYMVDIYEKKKLIIKLSRQISNLIHNNISECWRSVEISHQLKQAEIILEEKLSILEMIKMKKYKEKNNNFEIIISVEMDLEIYSKFVENSLNKLNHKLCIDKVWSEMIISRYNEDIKTRKSEDEMLQILSEKLNNITVLSDKRQGALEMYLHERFMVKKQLEIREKIENELREKISRFSVEMHAIKDINRIKQILDEEQMSNEIVEMEERQLEWRLMEDEIRLVGKIRECREKGEEKINKIN